MEGGPVTSRHGAQTLERGLDLLVRLARQPMRLIDLADQARLSASTTSRLVGSLLDQGFLTKDRDGKLRMGPMLMQLSAVAQSAISVLEIARPHLHNLSAATGFPSFLGERNGGHSVHLHHSAGVQRVAVATPVGTRRKLAETSLGKALMLDDDWSSMRRLFEEADPAYRIENWENVMPMSRERGVVTHAGPPPDSIRAAAAPLRDASGRIVAAISLVGVAQYVSSSALAAMAGQIGATAERISRELGHCPPGAGYRRNGPTAGPISCGDPGRT